MDHVIRTATHADGAACAVIDVATWSPLVTPAPQDDQPESFFGLGREPEDCFVAELDGVVAGYVQFRREIPIDANAHVWALRSLAVSPDHHGHGFGTRLVAAAIEELRSRGATRIRSRVLSTNPASLAVHRRLGFIAAGRLRGEFVIDGNSVDDILFTLDLEPQPLVLPSTDGYAFPPLTEERLDDMIEVMTSCRWEHFVRPEHTEGSVRELWSDGAFGRPDHATFFVEDADTSEVLGMVRLIDLQDPTPLFDIRIREEARGRGVGVAAVSWLTQHLFDRGFSNVQGYTRATNAAMRATFERCGYVKEGHMRADDEGGHEHIAYRILKRDVETGTTTPVRWFDV